MKRWKAIVGVVLLIVFWRSCMPGSGKRYIRFERPHEFSIDQFLPAGDSLVEEPMIIKETRPFLAEYPRRTRVRHLQVEERWTADSPHIATVSRGGIIKAHSPGWAAFTVKIRTLSQNLLVRVGLPMDSVVMRFSARQAMVGDTVELFFRRYYADGAEESAHMFTSEPEDRDRNGIPFASQVYVPTTRTGTEGDTLRFVARRPGRFHVKSTTHGRHRYDTLTVVKDLGRPPRLIKAPWWGAPQGPRAGRKPFRCYALSYGLWSDPTVRIRQEDFAWLPSFVELDSTLIVRDRADLGMRINAFGVQRLEMPRSWRIVGDSLRLDFETNEEWQPHQRVQLWLPFADNRVRGVGHEGNSTTDVAASRVPCV